MLGSTRSTDTKKMSKTATPSVHCDSPGGARMTGDPDALRCDFLRSDTEVQDPLRQRKLQFDED